MEQQEFPAGWWDADADRSLLAGVFKHGIAFKPNEKKIFFVRAWI